ncbi:DUF5010 domain-containing protein [Candidatus Microgenomates bacterium]|nr:DUF5010 domain-containing protein [Candidatus Microgenomates bacterium]
MKHFFIVIIILLALLGLALLNSQRKTPGVIPEPAPKNAVPVFPPVAPDKKLILTYYFYWYDAESGEHLQLETLKHTPPNNPAPSWKNIDWHKKELADMRIAGIDVVLPVYWGFSNTKDKWSFNGLTKISQAWQELKNEGQNPPLIGMMFDTTIINNQDLTTPERKEFFYSNIKDFFNRIPTHQRALINNKPVIFLFTSQYTAKFDQSIFDFVYQQFEKDFGVKPYIVREVSWDYPILRWEKGNWIRDYQNPIKTENSYLWDAAYHGYVDYGGVAAVGPGYDDRHLPDRKGGRQTDRQNGEFYKQNFEKALASKKPLIVIETWNEFHEGSGISETLEFKRQYIDLTKEFSTRFHK